MLVMRVNVTTHGLEGSLHDNEVMASGMPEAMTFRSSVGYLLNLVLGKFFKVAMFEWKCKFM